MGKLALVSRSSSSRENLKEAIRRHATAAGELRSLQAAAQRAREMVAAAEAKLADARGVVVKAREEQAQEAVEAASKGSVMKPGRMRDARMAEAEAEDELAAATAALQTLEGSLVYHRNEFTGESFDPVSIAVRHVEAEADAVVRDEADIPGIVAETARLQNEVRARQSLLIYLLKNGIVAEADQRALLDVINFKASKLPSLLEDRVGLADYQDRTVRVGRLTPNDYNEQHPYLQPWKSCRANLMIDASTSLPMVETD